MSDHDNRRSIVIQLLKQIHDTFARLAVEISGWPFSQFAPYFDSAVFSFEIGKVKPEPEIYQYALAKLGVSPENAIFIGDGSCNELAGARAIGMTTVMTTEYSSIFWPEKIPEIGRNADYVITDFNALLP